MTKRFYHLLVIVLFTTFLFPLTAECQKEGYIWYFGGNIGMDFHSDPPKLLRNSMLNTYEGCSSISDSDGNLLFYTDGVTIWDRSHQVMDNGDALTGHSSSTQSGLIVAKPGSKTIYYVFTVDASENSMRNGLEYAIVDLSEGNGKVIEKKVSLLTPGTEKVTGVIHKNSRDIWIISHKWNSDEFHSFLLTPQGLEKSAVISSCGSDHSGNLENAIGYLKASADGSRVAASIYNSALVEVFEFDNESGKLELKSAIKTKSGLPYGIEFSPNGRFIYISTHFDGGVYQFDLEADILEGSRSIIRKADNSNTGALQLAPDGNIYIQLFQQDYLAMIREPDENGISSRYREKGFYIGDKAGRYGLPTFVQSFFDSDYLQEIKTYYLDFQLTSEDKAFKADSIILRKGDIKEKLTTPPLEYPLKSNESLYVTIKRDGYFQQKFTLDSSNIESLLGENNKLKLDIDMQEIKIEEEITLDNIYYNYNSAELRNDATEALEKLLDLLQDNPTISIRINAHTDCRGNDKYNFNLSQRRARSVVDYLINNGIEEARLDSKGFGEQVPFIDCRCENCDEEEHQQNRRTTFQVMQ